MGLLKLGGLYWVSEKGQKKWKRIVSVLKEEIRELKGLTFLCSLPLQWEISDREWRTEVWTSPVLTLPYSDVRLLYHFECQLCDELNFL